MLDGRSFAMRYVRRLLLNMVHGLQRRQAVWSKKHFFILASFFSLISWSEAPAQITRSTTFDDRSLCEEVKGVWRQFGNGCADHCEPKFDEFIICTQNTIYACDCGKGRCWNGETCVSLESYKKIYEAKVDKERKILDEAREKRKALAKESEQAILAKLMKKDEKAASSPSSPTSNATQLQQNAQKIRGALIPSANTDNDEIPPLSPEQEAALKKRIQNRRENATVPPLFLQREQAKQALSNLQNQGSDQAKTSQTAPNQENSTLPELPVVPLPN